MTTAYPVVLFNSSTGSNTAASGAGPSVALTGTAASVAGTATSVSITDAVDLSGVATDGSAVLWYDDTTTGHRQFSQITAITGSSGAWTVTVASGYTTSTGPFSWAIGGARQSINGSLVLFHQGPSAGDAQSGWTAQMQSGYTETLASGFTISISPGYTTSGAGFIFEGDPAAATMPIITGSNNGVCINNISSGVILQNFELQNTNATKTASTAISSTNSAMLIRNVKIKDSTNLFNIGITVGGGTIAECEIAHCHTDGISMTILNNPLVIVNNYIHNNTAKGINLNSTTVRNVLVLNNIIANNGGSGINDGANYQNTYMNFYIGNTIDNNTGDGLTMATATAGSNAFVPIINNIFSNNGGYGIKTGLTTQTQVNGYGMLIEGNCFYNNTSGKYLPSILNSTDEQTSNPTYTNAAGGDYSIGSNLAAKGYPVGGSEYIGNYSSTYTYTDIGAAQRQATGGSGGILYSPGMDGGCNL